MKVGRESVWLVVPFTVGIAVVNYSLSWLYEHPLTSAATLVAAVAVVFVCVLATRKGTKRDSPWQNRLTLGAMFFFAGGVVCVLANLAELVVAAGAEGVAEGGIAGEGFAGGGFGDGGFAGEKAVRVSRIRFFINGCGERFRNMIDGMPFGDSLSNALLKALLAGDRSSLPWDVRNSFRAAGASHLLALSGLHLSVIYLVVSRILSVTGNSPVAVKVRSVLIILFSGFFTLITGASPSLMRAFLFITLRECAILTRRRTDNINIFCMSLMLQLALNPNDISSVGFQLSYLAMLGIFILEPPLERFWNVTGEWMKSLRREKKPAAGEAVSSDVPEEDVPKNGTISSNDKAGIRKAKDDSTSQMATFFGNAMKKIWSLCAVSISCQVFTAPAVLLYFGTFPRYFLLTNLLCLPLSNILITVSVVAVLLQMLGLCPAFLLTFIDFLVHTLIYILDIIAGM